MGLRAKLGNLKDKLKDLVEEKTWYTTSAFLLEALNSKIHLAIYLIEHLDGTVDKAKSKLKLQEGQQAADKKEKEREISEEREEELIRHYIDFLAALEDESAKAKNIPPHMLFVYSPFNYTQPYIPPQSVLAVPDYQLEAPNKIKISIR